MRTVYKYSIPVSDVFAIDLPESADFNHFALQGQELCAWFEVDTCSIRNVSRRFAIVGTGNPIPDGFSYCGTALAPPFVWHLYMERTV